MAFGRYDIRGGAVVTTLAVEITSVSTSLSLTAATGWPDGTPGPFWIVLDQGLSNEEKVLCTARSGTTISGLTRGADGTPAAGHTPGAQILHIFSATQADESNNATRQTLGNVAAKGDILTGSAVNALTRTAVGVDGLPLVANAAQPGGVTWTALGTTGILDNAVTTAKIADGTITSADIANGTIARVDMATGVAPVNLVANAAALAALTSPQTGELAYQQDIGVTFQWSGSAWLQTLTRAHRRRSRSVAQNCTTGVWTALDWNTETQAADPGNLIAYDSPSRSFSVSRAGVYVVTVNVGNSFGVTTAGRRAAGINLSGNQVAIQYAPASAAFMGVVVTLPTLLAVGDTIQGQVYQDSTATIAPAEAVNAPLNMSVTLIST